MTNSTTETGPLVVTVGSKSHIRSLAALLYDDVNVLEQWENDEKVAVIWQRSNDFLTTYQRDRLASGLFPTYDAWPAGLRWLADEMGLVAPCVEGPRCYACDGTGKASRGWSGNPSYDGITCPDCRGTGVDKTPYGTGSDHCAYCGQDWRQPHTDDCPAA